MRRVVFRRAALGCRAVFEERTRDCVARFDAGGRETGCPLVTATTAHRSHGDATTASFMSGVTPVELSGEIVHAVGANGAADVKS